MPINNNTRGLGTGFRPRVTARQFSDPNAAAISGEIARQNYRASFRSDYKLARLRKYVKKIVSTFSPGDKMAILSEYGDPRRGSSDDAVVEALITNLREDDLEALVKDVASDENKLGRTVNNIRNSKKKAGTRFSTKSFEEVYSNARKAKGPKDVMKAIKSYDKAFKVPREVRSGFGGLKREVEGVLNDVFSPIELTGLALKMQIYFEDNTSKKELVGLITNKVLLFVSLITGKTKAGYAGAIVDETPYREVLQYTTYSWAAGVSGMSKDGLKSLKEAAMEAKARSRETFTQRRKGSSRFGKTGLDVALDVINPLNLPRNALRALGIGAEGIANLLGSAQNIPGVGGALRGGMRGLFGGIGGIGGGIGGAIEYLMTGGRAGGLVTGAQRGYAAGTGALNNTANFIRNPFTFGERNIEREAAANVAARGRTTDDLDSMTTQQIFAEAAQYGLKPRREGDIEQLKRDIRIQREKKNVRRGRLERQEAEASRRGRVFDPRKAAELELLRKDKPLTFQSSAETPYLVFNSKSGRIELDKLKAVIPVFAVNDIWMKGEKQIESEMAGGDASKINNLNNLKALLKLGPSKGGISKEDYDLMVDAQNLKAPDRAGATKLVGPDMSMVKGMGSYLEKGGDASKLGYSESVFKSTDEKLGALFSPRMKTKTTASDKDYISLEKPTEAFVSKGARALRVFDVSAVVNRNNKVRPEQATGFFSAQAVNLGVRSFDPRPAAPVYIVNKTVPTDLGSMLRGIANMFLSLIPGGNIISGMLGGLSTGDSSVATMLGLPKFARGGYGKASNLSRKSTHFISGDSLNKSPNPEQVSINWSDKSFSVKPIPQLAEGGTGAQATGSQIRRMTASERQEPMKVFSVNTGVSDMVEVSGKTVSLIGLVSEMNAKLEAISGLLAIGNTNTSAIIKSTALTANTISKLNGVRPVGGGMNPFAGNGFPSDLNAILSGS
jgi:hypothetical protein